MELETFADPVRLEGKVRFVLWQSAFEFDVPERLVRDEAGRIVAFSTAEAAATYAAAHGITLSSYPPDVDPTHDLEKIATWTSQPAADTLDHEAAVSTWKFLSDAGVLLGMYDDGLDPALEQVVSQLDRAELVAFDAKSAHLTPKWTETEIALLAGTLRSGVQEFARLLTMPATV